MHVTFGSILVNESEYLLDSLQQHYQFCDRWVLVEGADRRYPAATADGLSRDNSAEIIRNFPDPDKKLKFIQHGWAESKQDLRNRYLEHTPEGILVVIDIDEFLTHRDMREVLQALRVVEGYGCLCIPHVHFWKTDASIITGKYYDVPHNRCYRLPWGCRYNGDHNHPELPSGEFVHAQKHLRWDRRLVPATTGTPAVCHAGPAWLHYGFCKDPSNIQAKNDYYISRGEATSRPVTTESRAAWFAEQLPPGLLVQRWAGQRPEVFVAKGAEWPQL